MIKLYDEDSYIKSFSAKVISCEKYKDGYLVLLDKTCFFPTAGGQSFDSGILDNQRVLDVQITDNNIYHFVKEPIEVGKTLKGQIDWNERFRKMQHHSAEHIFSGLVYSNFGYNNVGFHLNEKEVTMDYDGELTDSEILKIEQLANEKVQDNIEIAAIYPAKEELEKIDYRSKKELSGDVRIVTISGVDVCACCAPHVKKTGEIGLIKIIDSMRHRGGARLRMICGKDALTDYQNKQESAIKISKLLSKKQNELPEAVEKLLEELGELKQKNYELNKKLMQVKAENIPVTDGNLCVFLDEADRNSMRFFADFARERVSRVLAVLVSNQKGGYDYILTGKNIKLSDISKEINEKLSGRGGGKDDIEGTFGATKEEILTYFKTVSF